MELTGETNNTQVVEVERVLPGGVGLAHAEGMTVFVSLAAPGDVLRVSIDRIQGTVAFASILEIVKPGPERIEPPCPYFGRCGGCDFQQLTYQAQLDMKVEIIRDCLQRIAKVDSPPEISITRSASEWRYRARANWQVDSAEGLLGYFEARSNLVCDVDYCAVLAPELQETMENVRRALVREPDRPIRSIDVAVGDEGVSVDPPIAGFNTDTLKRTIGTETYYFNAETFFQVNLELLPPLIAAAIADNQGKTAVDLYSGVGLFTLPLARRFEHVTAVEAYPLATTFARLNLDHAGLENVTVATLSVVEWLKHYRSFEPPDFLLLDPPRAGCESIVVNGLISLRPLRIAYVSCDPATLARDLKKLIAGGYRLDSVAAFDMFPQTHHVETLAHLSYQKTSSLL
ncbi:MAG: rRNA (uracil1939-C5)-methyltransferase [Pyrinomonadaceae bacterium]|jgi:23S rRNA (uracil1939-C5)-methyltransferase|nr:rRNA (uracil1939-C5)-methyltransferase [Pyrinomonadaceae bacterium]